MCTKNIEVRCAHRQWIITNLDTLRSSVVMSSRYLYDRVVANIIEDLQSLEALRVERDSKQSS